MRRKRICLHVSLVSRSRPIAQGIASTFFANWGDKRSAIEQGELDALDARFRRMPPKNGLIWLVDY